MDATGRYEVLDIKFPSGTPALLLHTDGSGFAYYPSGRKAVCISSHGRDAKGKVRRISAVIHADTSGGGVIGAFDEWARGHAYGEQSVGEPQAPQVLFGESEVTVIDGSGGITVTPRQASSSSNAGAAAPEGGAAEVHLRLNQALSLRYKGARTTLEFSIQGIAHIFAIGEMHGEELCGMTLSAGASAVSSAAQCGEVTQQLAGVKESISALKVNPCQPSQSRNAPVSVNTSSFQDIQDSLGALQQTLLHPNLMPPNSTWKTEAGLKKLISDAHPRCPGVKGYNNWSIEKVGGRCTENRLASTKATVTAPRTVTSISQLQLPELISDCSSSGVLLVVVCLASFAQEPSACAKLLAEKANADLWERYRDRVADGQQPPVRMVAVELAESSGLSKQYDIREVPYCLMFHHGNCVHSKMLSAGKGTLRDTYTARPRILLAEPAPAFQLKLERTLRRNGYESDLAVDGQHALRLASRDQPYGVLLASALLPAELLASTAAAIKRLNPNALVLGFNAAVDAAASGADGGTSQTSQNGPFLPDCLHVFPYLPSYTGLATVFARHEGAQPVYKHVGQSKGEFVEEILATLERGGSQAQTIMPSGVGGDETTAVG